MATSKITRATREAGARLRRAIDRQYAGPGKPSLYRPGFCELATRYCILGATNEELGASFGVTSETILSWMLKYPEFKAAVHAGREGFDAQVAERFGQRALGFSHPEEVIHFGKNGEVHRAKTTKQYPPDTTAGIFWLKNRRPQHWKDRVEHTGDGGGPIDMTLNFLRPGEKPAPAEVPLLEKKEEKKK